MPSASETINISIHAPREGSDPGLRTGFRAREISIHAPREGSDSGGADRLRSMSISIHAPREGSDSIFKEKTHEHYDFYPRSP